MITTIIQWHDAKTDPPTTSGYYLTAYGTNRETRYMGIGIIPYSAKYRLFNAHDASSEEDAVEFSIEVDYWADLSNLCEIRSTQRDEEDENES